MATTKKRVIKPLVVKLTNAKGKSIEGIIPGGKLPTQDPFREIADELGNHHHLKPTAIPDNG